MFNGKKVLFLSSNNTVGDIHLYKEQGQIPYWLKEIYGFEAYIDDYGGNLNQNEFRGVHLLNIPSSKSTKYLKKIFRIVKYAKKIDILYLIHISPTTFLKVLAYRIGQGKGKVYVKCDMTITPGGPHMYIWKNMHLHQKIFHFLFKNSSVDIYTVESKNVYDYILESYYSDLISKEKFFLMPNGFDLGLLEENKIQCIPVSMKEKIIITTARLGTYEKNTELLLDILGSVDLKDWRVYLIGQIEESFEEKISKFYNDYPDKLNSVVFTGNISEKNRLYDYYNRARVFIFTSRSEGFAFSLVEAAYMRNYIISTDVGGAKDVLKYTNGIIISGSKKEGFIAELNRIINMSDFELNCLVKEGDVYQITWEWILMNNKGIQKIVNT